MLVFNSQIHIVTFLILLVQLLLFFNQIIHYLSRPSDNSRFRFLILILTYILYNLCSGLFPDKNITVINIFLQNLFAYFFGIVFASYYMYYIYKDYGIAPFKLFPIKFVILLLLFLFISFFIIPYIITDNLKISRQLFISVPLILCFVYCGQIIYSFFTLKKSKTFVEKHFKLKDKIGIILFFDYVGGNRGHADLWNKGEVGSYELFNGLDRVEFWNVNL